MAKPLKLARKVTGASSAVAMTDETYAKLGKAHQFLASLAEGCGIDVFISEYEKRQFVATQTIDALVDYFS